MQKILKLKVLEECSSPRQCRSRVLENHTFLLDQWPS